MNKRSLVAWLLVSALFLMGFSTFPQGTQAATLVIDSTEDTSDAALGNGVCADATGNCTLRAAIQEANALGGSNTIVFDIPTSDPGYDNHTGGSGFWWKITLSDSLPAVGSGSTIDGTTQTSNQGDTNPGQVGTGGLVGVDQISLPRYDRPEIEVEGGSQTRDCFAIGGNASDVTLQGLAVFFCDEAINANGGSGTNRVVRNMLVGTRADGSDPGSLQRNGDFGIRQRNGGTLTVTECYVGYNGEGGIVGEASNTTIYVTYNEVFANGWDSSGHDGIDLNGPGGEARYNLAWGNTCSGSTNSGCGSGFELGSQAIGTGGNLVENNTSTANRIGITNRKGADDNIVRKNLVTGNDGPGILVAGEGRSTSGNTISQNSIHGNGGLGIDLNADDSNTPGDGVTSNDGNKDVSLANEGLDFPVIASAASNGNMLTLSGYVGSAPSQSLFAGITVEFFISGYDGSTNPNPGVGNDSPPYHGEGQTYLGALATDGNGDFSGTLDVTGTGFALGDYVTATATDLGGNTSEFGQNVRAAFPTATTLASFSAAAQGSSVRLEWQTATELDSLGFDLYRAKAADGARVQLNGTLIPAQHPGSILGATYSFLDTTVEADGTYSYWLKDVGTSGLTTLHGPATATVPSGWRLRPVRPRPALRPVLED